ncbi:H-2 class II histocompatibility antigen [Huso huso]|uniref:H-2 class II histocompatibility antigen n=1 Tax=Huso huso TaxID=61971 RepID=A0ABR0Y137_HUSHU
MSENDYELDDDELFHVDFEKKEAVQRLPEFDKYWKIPPGVAPQAEANRQICINSVDDFARCHEYPPEEQVSPRVTLYPEKDLELGKPNTLICFITDFHPAAIKVTWTKNTLPVTEGVTLTQYYSNKDFTLQMFSYLSFTPELGDVYSCQVQHSALPETLTTFWEPDVQTDSDVGETAFCAVGLTLGLLGVAVGTFFLIKGNKCN